MARYNIIWSKRVYTTPYYDLLDAVQSHSDYLEGELSARNESLGALKASHGREVRALRGEGDALRLQLEQRERDLQAARMSGRRRRRRPNGSRGSCTTGRWSTRGRGRPWRRTWAKSGT